MGYGAKSGAETPSQIAKSWQGTVLYRGEPNETEYFTTLDAINRSGQKASVLYEGLQVEKHPILGYRNEMHGYLFTEDVPVLLALQNRTRNLVKGDIRNTLCQTCKN